MILVWLIVIPLLAGALAWGIGARHNQAARWVAVVALVLDLGLTLSLWLTQPPTPGLGRSWWLASVSWSWLPSLGITVHLAMDGLSLLLTLLTLALGILAVAASWNEVQTRVGFFHFNLLWILAGVLGVFLSLDLFLFYVFWELMLVPMYLVISIWGHEQRVAAALKFFIFTQVSGLLMLLAILGLVFAHYRSTRVLTFDYLALLHTPMGPSLQLPLMLGFAAAFLVKLPAVPLHTWLPDAHTEAPTAGSVILAGLLLKTGAYGLMRFAVPLYPEASMSFAPVAVALAVLGILYGALMALGQTDLKRLVAYSSVSHLGFVLLGIYSFSPLAAQGALLEMICHGFSTGGLFFIAGALQERMHTRDLNRMGGLWDTMPVMGGVTTVLCLASLGLPGLGNFVAEFLVLLGSYQQRPAITCLAALGLIGGLLYSLALLQRVFHGENRERWSLPDLSGRELAIGLSAIAILLWLGLAPQSVLDRAGPFTALFQIMPEGPALWSGSNP